MLVCCVIFCTFLNLWLTLDPLKRSILAPIRDRSEYSTFQWIERQPEVQKCVENCSTDAFSRARRGICFVALSNFDFCLKSQDFTFCVVFALSQKIRVSGILDKPSLGISNSKSLMSVSIAENVSSKIVCGRYLDLFC